MSVKRVEDKKFRRKLCTKNCGRKARFKYRGHVKADKNHTLCFGCFRSERDSRVAWNQKEAA